MVLRWVIVDEHGQEHDLEEQELQEEKEKQRLEQERRIPLTSGEVANLWTSYLNNSMASCTISYFLANVQDNQIRTMLEYALELSAKHVEKVKQIFTEEQYPVPQGFTERDVDPNAPRLYSDTLFLLYVVNMGKLGLTSYSFALATSPRSDIRNFYSECLAATTELFNKATEVLLEKGLYIRSPRIPKPVRVEYVHDQHFLGNFLNIGKERPLIAQEIINLTYTIEHNSLVKPLIMGFSQVAKRKEVRKFFERGRNLATKHIEKLSLFLKRENLPAPGTWGSEVTDSTIPPFSDKLMMYHISVLIAYGIGQYGVSASVSPRTDLATVYRSLALELDNYSNDGVNIMITNGWMEKPPQAVDHDALVKA